MNMSKDKKIYIVINMYTVLNGSIIDCIDLYINLKKYNIDCDLIIVYNRIGNTNSKIFMNLKTILCKYYTSNMIKLITKHIKLNDKINYNNILDDLIITDYNTLTKHLTKQHKVILISELTLMADLYNNKTNIKDLTDNYNVKKIIGTKFMKNYCDDDILFEYYMPLSEYRLNNVKIANNNIIYDNYNNYETDKLDSDFNIHNYAGIKYNRRYLPYHDVCMEAKGKLLFEFLYYNKYVYYNAVPKQDNDGLTDYLNYFNIDDNISQELKISKEEIYDKLIKFDSDNKILNLLNDI